MASEVMERDLYGDKYHLVHNPNARGRAARYTVTSKDGEVTKPQGVTTIISKTLSKDLMAWAVEVAMSYLETKVPVVTKEDLETAANEYNRLREAGGSTGSEAHAAVEGFLKAIMADKVYSPKKLSKEAKNAYNAFVAWFNSDHPEVLGVEETIYSENFKYAGTYDAILRIDGRTYLCDMKTTNPSKKAPAGVYAENFIQLGAYWLAREEQRKYELDNKGTELEEVDDLMIIAAKKNGVLDVVRASDLGLSLTACGEMFKRVVNINQFMVYTTKRLGGS